MDVCERCERPAVQVAGKWMHAEYADAVFCAMVMTAAPATAPAAAGMLASESEPRRTGCVDCGSMEFGIFYDPAAQGSHVECTRCGTVAGGLRR